MRYVMALVLLVAGCAVAAEIHVAPGGADTHAGTPEAPLKTVQAAVAKLQPGDTCMLHAGTYRESITIAKDGLSLQALPGAEVIFDGTETVSGDWEKHKGNIYKTHLPTAIEQLFVGRRMMIEARWPNMTFEQRFERERWKEVDPGSAHGKIISKAIAETGIDWTGAMACLNVAHQWWTWNRPITKHKAGSAQLQYAANLVGLCFCAGGRGKHWEDDYFYLYGKLEALDTETEWHYDRKTKTLYFYAPNGVDPSKLDVKYKSRNYAVHASKQHKLKIRGINFFACSLRLDDCNDCLVEDCELLYPTYTRTITDYDEDRKESVITKIVGDRNTVRRCSLAYPNNLGLMMMGNANVVENCIIHDVNWYGTLIYPALQLSASPNLGVNWFNTIQYPPTPWSEKNTDITSHGNRASRNTLYNCGNALLVYHAADSIVEYNHVYQGGKVCKDVSLIYGCWPFSRGSVVRYNWVHDCYPDHGGIGIRADDQSRHQTFHHNVVWNCGGAGMIVKGDHNRVFNNTVFAIGDRHTGKSRGGILIPARPEPVKRWAINWPHVKRQNAHTRIVNNVTPNLARQMVRQAELFDDAKRIHHNLLGLKSPPLMNIKEFDFRPKPGSALIDAGVAVPGFTDDFKGKAPDLGAYESGAKPWVAGADWRESFTVLPPVQQRAKP